LTISKKKRERNEYSKIEINSDLEILNIEIGICFSTNINSKIGGTIKGRIFLSITRVRARVEKKKRIIVP
jgi:hypothetical protein